MNKDPYREGWYFRRNELDNNGTKVSDGGIIWNFNETEEQFQERHRRKDKEAEKYPKNSFEQNEWYSGWIDCDMGTGRE